MGEFEPRPLNAAELAVLDLLLAPDFPGVDALRRQLSHVRVVGRCPCGCATVDLDVERGSCPPAPGRGRPIPSEAEVLTDAGAPLGGIIVFLKDGYLSTLEIYSVGPEPIRIWPQLDRLRPTLTS